MRRVAKPAKRDLVRALLSRHGRTYADELGIDVAKGTPSPLFRLLCASLLFSARIDAGIAADAARALTKRGWTTAEKLCDSTWEQRVDALNSAGYTRYQERTSTMLGDTAERLLESYAGDLRNLREEAAREPAKERRLLKGFKGMGDVGADILFRELQVAWEELRPFADQRALDAAKRLDLGGDVRALARRVDDSDLAPLVAALVRTELEDDYDAVRAQARELAKG